ncbi:hypothetical protein MFUR16E_04810 [Methylobacterium fujisawaense]|uniref:hypothetical protein n=1 Tax=Methylobacterium fujisawaense TaxID=107400 RepID=UPI002F34884E
MGRAHTLLAAATLLAVSRAMPASNLGRPAKARSQFSAAVQDALRGPEILPNAAGVRLEGTTGVLRTLELDDTTSLHLRVRIPF